MPDATLSVNAVRLMTVHGSKGLDFEAVHIASLQVELSTACHARSFMNEKITGVGQPKD